MIYETFGSPFFGFVTAPLATCFVGRDAENTEAELAGAKNVAAGLLYLAHTPESIRQG